MEGMARSVSVMEAISELCPPYGADADLAGRYARAFASAGSDAYGKKRFSAALQRERARRARETVGERRPSLVRGAEGKAEPDRRDRGFQGEKARGSGAQADRRAAPPTSGSSAATSPISGRKEQRR